MKRSTRSAEIDETRSIIPQSFVQGFMALGVQQIHRSETTHMATHMMENKNNEIDLQLSYKYQNLSYCLLSRSILGCFAFIRL